jgi:hypothetical protein
MTKPNIHTASRNQHGAAGSNARSRADEQWAQADERARAREGGDSVGRPHREEPPTRIAEATRSPRQLGVGMARRTAEAGAETATGAARSGLQIARRPGDAAGAMARRSAQGTAELGQALTELMQEQSRHNIATLTALTEAVDWPRLLRIQLEFIHASLERMVGFARRYLEVSQGVFTAAAKVPAAGSRDRDGSEAA